VLDWSEGGIGFRLPGSIVPPAPGQPLEGRLVGDDAALGGLHLLVCRVDRRGDEIHVGARIQPHEMGLLWRAPREDFPDARPIVGERDVQSFYRTLFRLPSDFVLRGTGALGSVNFQVAAKGVLARPEALELLCPQAADLVGVAPGQPLDLLVLALGSPHLLRSEIVAVRPDRLEVRLPGRLFSLARRDGARVACPQGSPCFLEARHPLDLERSIRFRVRDVSPMGLSLRAEGDLAVHPGPRLSARLAVPFRREMEVELETCAPRVDAVGPIVAARFARVSDEDRNALAAYLLAEAFPDVQDRGRFDAWGVWGFLRDAGYLALGAEAPEAPPAQTWDRLRLAGSSVSHDAVQVAEGAIVGHLSCLRLYRRTWLVHQLAVSPPSRGLRTGVLLYDYGATFLDTRRDDMAYMIAYFNQDLPWHRMFFSGFERRMGDPDLAVIHPFRRYVVETRGLVLDRIRDRSAIGPVGPDDAAEVAAFLAREIPPMALRALDLEGTSLLGDETARRFADRGLEWERVVLAQRLAGRLIAVAVCELCTPGLNTFGITDSAKVVCENMPPDEAAVAQRALLASVKRFYLTHGRERFFLLLDRSCSGEALEAAGAAFVETTGFVALSRAGVQNFRSFVRYEFARFRKLGGPQPAENPGSPGQSGDVSAG
jgi:hypothetical protein